QEQWTLLVDGHGRRDEQAVPDEHEARGGHEYRERQDCARDKRQDSDRDKGSQLAMPFITKRHIPRRTFLKGAGITLALPVLDAMLPASTVLAQTVAGQSPSRFV